MVHAVCHTDWLTSYLQLTSPTLTYLFQVQHRAMLKASIFVQPSYLERKVNTKLLFTQNFGKIKLHVVSTFMESIFLGYPNLSLKLQVYI